MRSFRAECNYTPVRSAATACLIVMVMLVVAVPSSSAQAVNELTSEANTEEAFESQTRIRIAFGGAKPTIWQGEIFFPNLKPSELQQLSLEPSSVGAAWIEGDRIKIRHERPIGRDAYDITLHGPVDSEIEVRLTDGISEPTSVRLVLKDIRKQPQTAQLGKLGRFVAERMPDDRLHVRFDKPTRIYAPSDELSFEVSPDTEELEPTDFFDFKVRMTRARSTETIWESEPTRHEVPVKGLANCPVSIPLPDKEGVYNIHLSVERPAGFTSRFLPNGQVRPFAERSLQVLVFDKIERPAPPSEWSISQEINPANVRQTSRIPEWMDWRRFAREEAPARLASFEATSTRENRVVIPSASKDQDGTIAANWQAFTLPIQQPGEPYLIEVVHGKRAEQDLEQSQSLGITVLDKSSQGELVPLAETLIHQSASWNPEENESVKVLVWPHTNSPLLLVSNPSTIKSAGIERIRIYRQSNSKQPKTSQRQLSLRWRNPELEKAVGASLSPSPGKLYEYADLQTRYEVAQRIADQVQISGANGAVIPLNDRGGALTSVPSLSGTPRFDMATWALGTSDLPAIDPLELLLLEFDRRRLDLTPCVSLSSPLPLLEKRRRIEQNASYLWSFNLSSPKYNPLHDGVIEEVRRIGIDLKQNYEHHRSLGRLALEIGSNGALIQPNSFGGFDRETVDRFLRDSRLNWPDNLPRDFETHAGVIEQNASEPWISWKKNQQDQIANSLASAFRSRRGKSPLIITDELTNHESLRRAATPKLGRQVDLQESFAETGILSLMTAGRMSLVHNVNTSGSSPNRLPKEISFWNAIAQQRDLHSASQAKTNQLLAKQTTIRLAKTSDFFGTLQSPDDFLLKATYASTALTAQRLSLATADTSIPFLIETTGTEQGWYDEDLVEMRQLFTSIPADKSNTESQPNKQFQDIKIAINEQSRGKAPGTVLVASNQTSWQRNATLTIDIPQRSLAIPINSDRPPEWFESGKHAIQIRLKPYESIAWRFSSVGVECLGTRIDSAPNAVEEIRQRIERLKLADHSARRVFTPLINPSFEEREPTGSPTGWQLTNAGVDKPNGFAVDGSYSLAIHSESGEASASSAPFPLPNTGQLAIQFQATSIDLAQDTEFMIEFSTVDGQYESRTTVRSNQLPSLKSSDVESWTELIFAVDDLPIDSGKQMQVRFALIGKGTVLVDNLRCEDLMLPLPAYIEDTKSQKLALVQLKLAAEQALDEGRLADCQQILDSYWGQFLVNNFPQLPPVVQQANSKPDEQKSPKQEPKQPDEESVADRFRGYWPKLWR